MSRSWSLGSTQQQYWLSPHVHVCVTDDYAVALDLRRDKYIGIGREHLPALAAAVADWPVTAASNAQPSALSKVLLEQMLAAGLLTTDAPVGGAPRTRVVSQARLAATEADLEYRPVITARNVAQVLIAAARAKVLLKWRPIETVVARVRRRKENAGSRFDLEAARPLIEAFLYLRPLFFTTKDECLFDSLVLVELLARNHLFPDWLFGVSTHPFRAHSWVQADDRVLNDLPERISQFTPILAV